MTGLFAESVNDQVKRIFAVFALLQNTAYDVRVTDVKNIDLQKNIKTCFFSFLQKTHKCFYISSMVQAEPEKSSKCHRGEHKQQSVVQRSHYHKWP